MHSSSYRARQLKTWVYQRNDVVIKTGFKANNVIDHIVNLEKQTMRQTWQKVNGVIVMNMYLHCIKTIQVATLDIWAQCESFKEASFGRQWCVRETCWHGYSAGAVFNILLWRKANESMTTKSMHPHSGTFRHIVTEQTQANWARRKQQIFNFPTKMRWKFPKRKLLKRLCNLLYHQMKLAHRKFNYWYQCWNSPYFFLVGADVEQRHRTIRGAAGSRGHFWGRTGLGGGGQRQGLRNRLVSQSGGEVLLHLLPLCLLDVVLGGVLQVGLHLIIQTAVRGWWTDIHTHTRTQC